ncbi:hypothetical protein Cgig2_033999 [Carnegiea gigantea]|uniref:GRF-like zinc ribbon domain-containing protein n=1 Tax=Carnegiea gigantea TaxID=171969 RepID=A0A9Q1Q8B1_9CARY|nr:hypothetical protein Cgig2_033999 [Carnegiea gigantea]
MLNELQFTGLIMEGSSSSRSKLASEDIAVCRRCNCEGVRKVSHSSQNLGRLYFKCLRCDKFLKWAANEGPQERPVVVDVDIENKELMEMRLMLKFIKKGQTLILKTMEHNNPLTALSSSKYILHYVCKDSAAEVYSLFFFLLPQKKVQEQCLLALMRAAGRKEKEKHLLTRYMQLNHINRDDKIPY